MKKTKKEAFRMKGALWSAKKTTTKKNWAEKAKETARKSNIQGRKVPLKKNLVNKYIKKP